MIFYGPSGTGKTAVANRIAAKTIRTLYKRNATTASTADIKNILELTRMWQPFNKIERVAKLLHALFVFELSFRAGVHTDSQ